MYYTREEDKTNLLNSQNYVINKKIKNCIAFDLMFKWNNLFSLLKVFYTEFISRFWKKTKEYILLISLHLLIFTFCSILILIYLFSSNILFIYLYFILGFYLSMKLLDFYEDFKLIKIKVMWFRYHMDNEYFSYSYSESLICEKTFNEKVLMNNFKNFFASLFYSWIVNWIFIFILLYNFA